MGSSPPFSQPSPTPRRLVRHLGPNPSALPTSASDGFLTLKQTSLPPSPPPPPSQPSHVRPFLLRTASPAAKSPPGSKPRPSSVDSIVPSSPPAAYGAAPTRRSGPTVSKSAAAVKSRSLERVGGRVVKEGLATSAPSGGKVNAVEEQKGRMKRESLLARKEKGSLGAGDERSVETGKRWFAGLSAGMGRVVRGAEPVVLVTKKTSLGDLTNRAPSPTHPPSPVADSFRTPTRPRSMSPPRTPTSLRSSVSISALRDGKSKRAEAAQIGLGRSPTKQRAKSTVQATPDGASYSSLRDMLESSGFADTRVITPIQRPPPILPPSPTLRPRSSLLSLSSLLTLWAPRDPSPPSSPSPLPLPLSTSPSESHSRALLWAQDVASSLDVPPPPLPSSHLRTHSPPLPPPSLSPRKSSAPSLTLTNAQRSLRHVVSDPSIASTVEESFVGTQRGGYQSFALGGQVVPLEVGRREYGDRDEDEVSEGRQRGKRSLEGRRKGRKVEQREKVVEQSWFGGLRERASHVWLGAAYFKAEKEVVPPVPRLLRKAVSSAVLRDGAGAKAVVSMEEAYVWPERWEY